MPPYAWVNRSLGTEGSASTRLAGIVDAAEAEVAEEGLGADEGHRCDLLQPRLAVHPQETEAVYGRRGSYPRRRMRGVSKRNALAGSVAEYGPELAQLRLDPGADSLADFMHAGVGDSVEGAGALLAAGDEALGQE